MEKRKKIYTAGFFVLTGIGICFFWYIDTIQTQNDLLRIVALDVGQGSSMYVSTPNNIELLVDTGPSGKLFRSLHEHRSMFDRTIDYLFISHLDNDHMAMAPRVLHEYTVNNLVTTRDNTENGLYREVIHTLQTQDTQTRILLPTSGKIQIVDADTYIQYLWPEQSEQYKGNRNDTSLVLRLVHKNVSVLFTGDISKKIEEKLVQKYGDALRSDILFVSHHGSKTSTNRDFVRMVSPDYAVIQSGKENRYGHPHKNTIDTLSSLGIPILRNDILGSIEFITDGEQILVQ